LGYRLRRVQKAKPLKRIPQTDDIFKNVEQANRQADEKSGTKRISVDVKAKVSIGEFSRNGKSRGKEAEKAVDHDVSPDAKLVPVGILDTSDNFLSVIFGNSLETSDLIVDSLELWWEKK
jgi:Rhodopirellula transposase DDE domain